LDPELEIKIKGYPKTTPKNSREELVADLKKKFMMKVFTDSD
jgi:hypothetical protein